VLKAFSLIFAPARTWEKIVRSQRGVGAITFLFLLPVMLICSLVEGYGMTRVGERRGFEGHLVAVTRGAALRFEVAQLLLGLLTVFVGAKILEWITESFHLPVRYTQVFTVVAYGYSPVFMVQLLDGFLTLNTWVWWALGIVGCLHVLYHGIGLVLQPDQTKGFGLFLMGSLILILLGGPTHLIAHALLNGRIAYPRL
jgi:Yip1 domain